MELFFDFMLQLCYSFALSVDIFYGNAYNEIRIGDILEADG